MHAFLLCAVFRQTPHHHYAHVYRDSAGRIVTPIPVPVLAAILIYRALAEFCVALLHPPWCAFVVYNNNTTTNNSSAGSHTHTHTRDMDPVKMKVVELRAELGQRGLDQKGVKAVLVQRLQAALEADGHAVEKGKAGWHTGGDGAAAPWKVRELRKNFAAILDDLKTESAAAVFNSLSVLLRQLS